MRAPDILKRAAQHMEDRAAARDQAQGERSMARTVAAFNALTGHQLTERDGWMFMVALKAARACTTPNGIADDYEDGAAYFGLAGECAHKAKPLNSEIVIANDDAPSLPVDDGKEVGVPIEGGLMLLVPPGYKWVAQDMNGIWYAYSEQPQKKSNCWDCSGPLERIGYCDENPNWHETLRQVRQ